HRGFDQGTEITAIDRQVQVLLQMPADADMDPEFEQDERDQYSVKVGRLELAMPEMFDRIGIDGMKDQNHGHENRSGPDQGLDPDQFGAHHLLHQGMLKLGRYRRALAFVSPQPQHSNSLSFPDVQLHI